MATSDLMAPTLAIPGRSEDALGGSVFVGKIQNLPLGQEREAAILEQFLQGNVPDFMRDLCAVRTSGFTLSGAVRDVTIWVTPDYLCLGSDEDFVRVPMGPRTAQQIADSYGALLPTRRIVDHIHMAADVLLNPTTQPPTTAMTSVLYFARHNHTIEQQLLACGATRGALVSGHKKDVVLCKALEQGHDDRVAIYGWCDISGKPIQGLNASSHSWLYADYSHGIRLVSNSMVVNGEDRAYDEVLTNPAVASAVSDEGFLTINRYPQT